MRISIGSQPKVNAYLSEGSDGDMNFSGGKKAERNRSEFLSKLDINPDRIVGAGLAHEDNIEIVGGEDRGKLISETDALLTSKRGVYLALTVADCLPVFLFEPKKEIIGLVHCGWQGLALNILCKTCGKIEDNWGKGLDHLLAFIGPGICGNCYEIHQARAKKFSDYPQALKKRKGRIYLDLRKVAQEQLLISGAKKGNIKISSKCTAELPSEFFSYWQRDSIERMIAVMGLRG